jgi:hypothetical protein
MRMMRRTIRSLTLKIASMLSDPTGLIKDFHEEFDTIPELRSM